MDKLPLEVMLEILSHLSPPPECSWQPTPPLAPYASISRRFQHVVESRILSGSTLKVSSDDLETFTSAFSDIPQKIHRRAMLRSLRYIVKLPPPSAGELRRMPDGAEKAVNNKVWTQGIVRLFDFLATWESVHQRVGTGGSGVSLEIGAWSMADQVGPRGFVSLRNRFTEVGFDADFLIDCDGGRRDGLSQVGVIRHLEIGNGPYRRVDPTAAGVLARALPNLRGLTLWFYPVGQKMLEDRKKWRRDLAESLIVCAEGLVHLTTFNLLVMDREPQQECEPGRLVEEGERDELSFALRKVSQLPALRELSLGGQQILSRDLFEDGGGEDSGSWPSLVDVVVAMSWITPHGRWAITGDPGSVDALSEDEEEETEEPEPGSNDSDTSDHVSQHTWSPREEGFIHEYTFRSEPVESILEPFLTAMARATTRMPKLQHIKLHMGDFTGLATIMVEYHGPGQDGPRWIINLHEGFANWEIPPQLKAALVESAAGEGGNVHLIRTRLQENSDGEEEDTVEKGTF
ncbi:hypothetical protein QBC44DRAFT_403027 [Cladorrhinum sp. PSN332]|nr:hypothetical protein QBC44DRAFT_403027 [Cladorrhinum sp. PSN332]